MENELKVIPKKVTDMAKFITDCYKEDGIPVVIMSRRGWGKIRAFQLATQTQDIECEVIPPKAIEEGKAEDEPSVARMPK